jgi:gamma-glutamylcyclotransferase (GGCT)/AIG2-like uncharacterized protein YtfP
VARVSAEPAPLFVYGSLLFPDVLQVLIDRDPEREPAAVDGWRVVALPDVVYPTLIRDGDGFAAGDLLIGLTPAEWQTLDTFEASGYDLAPVRTRDGQAAYTYAEPAADTNGRQPWDAQHFGTAHLTAYVERCARWRQWYEARVAD